MILYKGQEVIPASHHQATPKLHFNYPDGLSSFLAWWLKFTCFSCRGFFLHSFVPPKKKNLVGKTPALATTANRDCEIKTLSDVYKAGQPIRCTLYADGRRKFHHRGRIDHKAHNTLSESVLSTQGLLSEGKSSLSSQGKSG